MKVRFATARISLVAVLLFARAAAAEDAFPIYRHWKGMYSSVGKEMGLILNTGAFVRGRAVAIREDGIVVEVKKTSDPQAYPKKKLVIPRGDVSEIELYERTGRRTSEDSRDIANAERTAAIGIGGSLGIRHGGLLGGVMGGVLGNLAGTLGAVAIRKIGSETREEIIRIRIVPDDAAKETIPAEVLKSGQELMESRLRDRSRIPMQRRSLAALEPPTEPTQDTEYVSQQPRRAIRNASDRVEGSTVDAEFREEFRNAGPSISYGGQLLTH